MSRRVSFANIASAVVQSSYRRMAVDFGAPLRALNLRTAHIPVFDALPACLPVGDVAAGQRLLDGRINLGSQGIDVGQHGDPWLRPAPSEPFAYQLHSFNWLADIAAIRLDTNLLKKNTQFDRRAELQARHLVDQWVCAFGQWNSYAWDNEILTNRVFSWFSNWKILLDSDSGTAEGAARRICLYRQLKHLRSTYKRTPAGLSRFKAAACLVLAGVCNNGKQGEFLDRGLDLFDDEIDLQILPDGGHVSRSPQQCAKALEILLVVECALEQRGMQGSKEIRRAIDRLTPMVSFLSDGNGHLFGFNGGGTGRAKYLKTLLKHTKLKTKQFSYAPHTKFQRLEKNGTIILMDIGGSPPRPYDLEAHLAPLAFEMTTDAGPLIVNCGWNADQPMQWRESMRGTPAHSTLILGGNNAGELVDSSLAKWAIGDAILKRCGPVHCTRKEQDNGTWLEMSHESYEEKFGLLHRRRLYMDLMGSDIRGEDSLLVPLGAAPVSREEIPFEIRFHLHPNVKVTLAQDQKSALLILSGGKGWRFRTDMGPLCIEKSVYLAEGHKPRRCEQIVINGRAYGDGDGRSRSNRVRWSLKQLGGINMDNMDTAKI